MTRRLAALALVAGCASQTPVTTRHPEGELGARVVTGTATPPSPVSTPARVKERIASRSRVQTPAPVTGTHLSSTAYCETGLMANGQHTYRGAVAGNRWRLGTKLRVSDSPYGPGVFTVADRIGHGSSLDFAIPGDCAAARTWGRRTVRVAVIR